MPSSPHSESRPMDPAEGFRALQGGWPGITSELWKQAPRGEGNAGNFQNTRQGRITVLDAEPLCCHRCHMHQCNHRRAALRDINQNQSEPTHMTTVFRQEQEPISPCC